MEIGQVDGERRVFDVENCFRRILDPVLEDVVALEVVQDLVNLLVPGNGRRQSEKKNKNRQFPSQHFVPKKCHRRHLLKVFHLQFSNIIYVSPSSDGFILEIVSMTSIFLSYDRNMFLNYVLFNRISFFTILHLLLNELKS